MFLFTYNTCQYDIEKGSSSLILYVNKAYVFIQLILHINISKTAIKNWCILIAIIGKSEFVFKFVVYIPFLLKLCSTSRSKRCCVCNGLSVSISICWYLLTTFLWSQLSKSQDELKILKDSKSKIDTLQRTIEMLKRDNEKLTKEVCEYVLFYKKKNPVFSC